MKKDSSKPVPLIEAAAKGDVAKAAKLLASGAKVDPIGPNGVSPLMRAADNGHLQVIRLLLEAGAVIDRIDKDGNNALAHALLNREESAFEKLLESGADPHSRVEIGAGDNDPLSFAVTVGLTRIVGALLKKGVLRNRRPTTLFPLIVAAENEHIKILKSLLAAGADVDETNRSQETALMKAVGNGAMKSINVLIEAGANLDLRDTSGRTALIWAVLMRRTNVVRVLVKAGANLDIRNRRDTSAIMFAVHHEQREITQFLKDSGARIRKNEIRRVDELLLKKSSVPAVSGDSKT